MKKNASLAAIVIFLIATSLVDPAHAIGDSGGCGSFSDTNLGRAVRSGMPPDVEVAINSSIAYYEKQPAFSDLLKSAGGDISKARLEKAKEILNGINPPKEVCPREPLLSEAVAAGNIAVVDYLLKHPAGIDRSKILRICRNGGLATQGERAERGKKALAMVLDDSIESRNLVNQYGDKALEVCYNPLIVHAFLKRGAKSTTNLLERSFFYNRDLELTKLYAEFGANSIVGMDTLEKQFAQFCARAETYSAKIIADKKRTCDELSGAIKASPGVFSNGPDNPFVHGRKFTVQENVDAIVKMISDHEPQAAKMEAFLTELRQGGFVPTDEKVNLLIELADIASRKYEDLSAEERIWNNSDSTPTMWRGRRQ